MSHPPVGGRTAVSILLADPHPVCRAGVKAMLLALPDVCICAETGSGPAAVALAAAWTPDVVIAEASCPELGGPELVTRLRAACPGAKVLVLTGQADRALLRGLLAAGAAGYVLKRSGEEQLVQAVRTVAGGATYLDPEVAGWVVGGFLAPAGGEPEPVALSNREEQVLRLIALGYSNKEIGSRLRLSVKTVEMYKARAMEKLGVRTRVGIVRYAVECGWLAEPITDSPAPHQHSEPVEAPQAAQ